MGSLQHGLLVEARLKPGSEQVQCVVAKEGLHTVGIGACGGVGMQLLVEQLSSEITQQNWLVVCVGLQLAQQMEQG